MSIHVRTTGRHGLGPVVRLVRCDRCTEAEVGTLKKLADVASVERAFTVLTRTSGEQLKLGKGQLVAEVDENDVVTVSEESTGRPVMYMPVDVYEQMSEPIPVGVVKVEEKL